MHFAAFDSSRSKKAPITALIHVIDTIQYLMNSFFGGDHGREKIDTVLGAQIK